MSTPAHNPDFLYPSPLGVYAPEFLQQNPLDSEARNPDGKSLVNPPTGKLSEAYETFPEPIVKTNNGFDFHSESDRAVSFGLYGSTLAGPLGMSIRA